MGFEKDCLQHRLQVQALPIRQGTIYNHVEAIIFVCLCVLKILLLGPQFSEELNLC